MFHSDQVPTPLEEMLETLTRQRKPTIGLPRPGDPADRRFPLTPEAAGLLVARGFSVKMEKDGAETIHYDDLRYNRQGVETVERREALRCDIVIYLSPLTTLDARSLKRGSLLFTLSRSVMNNPDVLNLLLINHIITIALDRIEDNRRNRPFADILSEISGRAAMSIASALLADSVQGKGILLGGVAGIVPCEVTILGSGIDACAAARSALGLGAMVRMFDNDTYRLRDAIRELGPGVSGSAIHPRVLVSALHSADVVVATEIKPVHVISVEVVREMKQGVIIFDLSESETPVFPSLAKAEPYQAPKDNDGRVCYVNPGNAVPRTIAMALSNSFMTMITDIFTCEGVTNALMMNSGLQKAALTFLGKAVDQSVARRLGVRHVDIKLLLQFS